MVIVLALIGCGTDDAIRGPRAEGIVEMAPADILLRTSLDLRGVRPSVAELEQLEADPAQLEALIDGWLDDDRFGDRVRDLFAEVYLTRTETWFVDLTALGLDLYAQPELIESLGDEPLRLLAHLAVEDRPLTELVTADYTVANEVLAQIYPLDYPGGATGWQVARYTDGRPAAGVLATNGLWWRFQSTDSNANRKRANTLSRILLCHDYLTRPIEFDRNVNLLDEGAVADALRTNPGCVNCHNSLDPMASYLFGFQWTTQTGAEMARYHPSRELNWKDATGVAPAFYGQPGSSLADLGRQIAGDNRFPECLVQHTVEQLLQRDVALVDFDTLTHHRDALLAGEMRLKPLIRSVIGSPEYRAASDDGLPGTAVPQKMATPGLLASQIADLTGYRLTSEGWDLLTSEQRGYLTLAGGADGQYVTRSSRSPNTSLLLVQERLAEAAAEHAVVRDYADPANAELFVHVDFNETPADGREAMVAQLQHLHHRLYGARLDADGDEIAANLGLWEALYEASEDPVIAWIGVFSALLRDPELLFY